MPFSRMDEPVYNLVMPGMKRLWWIVIVVCAAAPGGAQPSPQGGSATVAGTLVSADSGRPIRRAVVKLGSTSPSRVHATTTDANGRFRFTSLSAADYTLSAAKPGFLESVYGARRPGAGVPGAVIHLADRGYSVRGRPAGHYRLAVVDGVEAGQQFDPAFLAQVDSEAVAATVAAGTRATIGRRVR